MARNRQIGKAIRWGLFALWVLCMALGIFYLFFSLRFDFGASLLGTPSLFTSYFYCIFENLSSSVELNPVVLSIVYLGLFIFTQWLFLSSKKHWKVKTQKTGRPMKASAIGLAFAVSLLTMAFGFSIYGLITNNSFEDSPNFFLLSILPALWIIWSIVFSIYFYQSDYLKWSGRIIKGLIGGSILELFISIPIFVTRDDDCYCARGSYAGLVFGTTVLLWAFGPGVYLLFLREKKRLEKIEAAAEGQSNNQTA